MKTCRVRRSRPSLLALALALAMTMLIVYLAAFSAREPSAPVRDVRTASAENGSAEVTLRGMDMRFLADCVYADELSARVSAAKCAQNGGAGFVLPVSDGFAVIRDAVAADAPSDGASYAGISSAGASSDGTSYGGASSGGTFSGGASSDGASSDGTFSDGTFSDGASSAGVSSDGTSYGGATYGGTSYAGISSDGASISMRGEELTMRLNGRARDVAAVSSAVDFLYGQAAQTGALANALDAGETDADSVRALLNVYRTQGRSVAEALSGISDGGETVSRISASVNCALQRLDSAIRETSAAKMRLIHAAGCAEWISLLNDLSNG